MIKYAELVDYIKENHVNWNTDLFEVLRGFFEQYYQPQVPSPAPPIPTEWSLDWESPETPIVKKFNPPADGEYKPEDVLELLST